MGGKFMGMEEFRRVEFGGVEECAVCGVGDVVENSSGMLPLTPTSSTNKVLKCTPPTCTACPALSKLSGNCSPAAAGGVSGP